MPEAAAGAGVTDTAEELGEADVVGEVGGAVYRGRPVGVDEARVAAELVADAQGFLRAQLLLAPPPVGGFGLLHGRPVPPG